MTVVAVVSKYIFTRDRNTFSRYDGLTNPSVSAIHETRTHERTSSFSGESRGFSGEATWSWSSAVWTCPMLDTNVAWRDNRRKGDSVCTSVPVFLSEWRWLIKDQSSLAYFVPTRACSLLCFTYTYMHKHTRASTPVNTVVNRTTDRVCIRI